MPSWLRGKSGPTAEEDDDGTPSDSFNADVPIPSTPLLADTWRITERPQYVRHLNRGGTVFAFTCKVGNAMPAADRAEVASIVNLSSFPDEQDTNNVPVVDMANDQQAGLYTIVVTKVAYLLPNVRVQDMTPEFMCSYDYQKGSQPGNPSISKDPPDATTIRFTKTIIKVVFKVTLQLKTSVIPPDELERLAKHMEGPPIHHGLLLERTKRRKDITDSTAKIKSVLLYTEVPGGLLVRHLTCVFNTVMPAYGAWVVNNLATFGANEAAQTAEMTRTTLTRLLARQRAAGRTSGTDAEGGGAEGGGGGEGGDQNGAVVKKEKQKKKK